MKLRIISAIMTVAGLTVLVLGIPLAIAVHRSILDSEVVKAQAAAARALPEIDVPLNRQQLTKLYSEPDAPPPFSVYAPDGSRLFGSGPTSADATVRRALAGEQASTTDGEIVVATPIVDINSEQASTGRPVSSTATNV